MATTASGWPYVEPADHPVEFPASSQALASKLEAWHLRTAVATKGTDQSGIASGGSAGFTATLTGVPAGAPVLGYISLVGSVTVAGTVYLGAAWTGGTAGGSPPQFSAPTPGWWQLMYVGQCIATGGNVTLTFNLTTSGGASWTCHQRSTIVLATI